MDYRAEAQLLGWQKISLIVTPLLVAVGIIVGFIIIYTNNDHNDQVDQDLSQLLAKFPTFTPGEKTATPVALPTQTPTLPPTPSLSQISAQAKAALKGVCPQTPSEVSVLTVSPSTIVWREDTLGGGRIWSFTAPALIHLTVVDGSFEDFDTGTVSGSSHTGPARIDSKGGQWTCTAQIPR